MKYANEIKEQILSIENGKLFVSSDFSSQAPRHIIDTLLHRMARRGLIVRVTRGIFMKESEDAVRPTVQEVAEAKARAFCKDISFLMARVTSDPNSSAEKSEHIYLSTGPSSSFRYGNARINFIGISPRKLSERRKRILEEPSTSTEQKAIC